MMRSFTSSTNNFNINGLTIKALATTAAGETLSINTDTDTQGLYDKIKDFLTQYNEIINEITSLYNADSAKGYDPLTDDEKSSMSDSEIEKWGDQDQGCHPAKGFHAGNHSECYDECHDAVLYSQW